MLAKVSPLPDVRDIAAVAHYVNSSLWAITDYWHCPIFSR